MVNHAAFIKEKTMAPESRFFRVSISAALAIALIVLASPARAEVVTLICQSDSSDSNNWEPSFTIRIDYDRKTVDWLRSNGTVALSSAATITESDVQWYSAEAQEFRGGLNRLSGQGTLGFTERQVIRRYMSGPCRRATQKF